MDIQTITSEIENIADNVGFPAHKDEIIDQAKQQGASTETQSALQKLPSQQFGSVEELMSKIPMDQIKGELGKFL